MFTYTKEMVRQSIEASLERVKPYHQNVLQRIEEMSPGQKRKMASLFTHPCNFNDAIFFCDMTMFGSGKKGFVITKDAVYFTKEFMKYPDSNVEIRTQVLSFAYMLRVALGHDGAHKYIDIEFIINNKHQRAQYYLSGKEDFFAAILEPIVELRLQAERREREEKERIRKEEQKAELERIHIKDRLAQENRRKREKKALQLVEEFLEEYDGVAMPWGINVIHDTFEYEGIMYCLAETVAHLGDLDVFYVRFDYGGEKIQSLMRSSSGQDIKDKYWEYMKSRKN